MNDHVELLLSNLTVPYFLNDTSSLRLRLHSKINFKYFSINYTYEISPCYLPIIPSSTNCRTVPRNRRNNKIPQILLIAKFLVYVTRITSNDSYSPKVPSKILSYSSPVPPASYLEQAMIAERWSGGETSPLVISKVNHPSLWIDHYGLMRSEINGIESWHGIVPRKPGRNPSAYYGRTSKATVVRGSTSRTLQEDTARASFPLGIPLWRRVPTGRTTSLHGRCMKGLSIPTPR